MNESWDNVVIFPHQSRPTDQEASDVMRRRTFNSNWFAENVPLVEILSANKGLPDEENRISLELLWTDLDSYIEKALRKRFIP